MNLKRFGKALWTVGAWCASLTLIPFIVLVILRFSFNFPPGLYGGIEEIAFRIGLIGLILLAIGHIISYSVEETTSTMSQRITALEEELMRLRTRIESLEQHQKK